MGMVIFFMLSVFAYQCIGPEGPPGMDGSNGTDGSNGEDASSSCILCHNNDPLISVLREQLSLSDHTSRELTSYCDRSTCSRCHVHQGFQESLATGNWNLEREYMNPASMSCRTCHLVHTNYDEADYMIVYQSPVELAMGGATVDLGISNLCICCHQARNIYTFPVKEGPNVDITSIHWGPHHGPEANIIWSVSAYDISGSALYPGPAENPHINAGCVGCHMAPFGSEMGGHSFNLTIKNEFGITEEEHMAACLACHVGAENFNINGRQAEIAGLLGDLENLIEVKGWWMKIEGEGPFSGEIIYPLNLTADQAGTLLNFVMILEDGSLGIHNPAYVKALLINSIEFLQAN